jgi:hypothetical protein
VPISRRYLTNDQTSTVTGIVGLGCVDPLLLLLLKYKIRRPAKKTKAGQKNVDPVYPHALSLTSFGKTFESVHMMEVPMRR